MQLSIIYFTFLNSNFFSALAGAIVGGLFAVGVQVLAIWNERRKDSERAKEKELGLLQALHDEMDVLWKRYETTMGSKLEEWPENKAILTFYSVTQNYFAVYSRNTDKIGLIRDSRIRHLIVSTYTEAMGMVESFIINNEMVRKYEHFDTIFRSSNLEKDRLIALGYLKPCEDLTPRIKKSHFEFKSKVQQLLSAIKNYTAD